MAGSFVDSNVLLYVASADAEKARKAEEILAAGGAISVQVLNEITNVARRRMHMSWAETHIFLNAVRGLLSVHPLTVEMHETGLEIAERYQLSVYDSMIVAAAVHAGCDVLWSEDMHDGLVVAGKVRVVNPFRGSR